MCVWGPGRHKKRQGSGLLEDLVEWVGGGEYYCCTKTWMYYEVECQIALFILPNWLFF